MSLRIDFFSKLSFSIVQLLIGLIINISVRFPKARIFLCGVCQNELPTHENLYKRKITLDPMCTLSSQALETVEHLFLLCC